MSENLKLWQSVEKTDPKHVKAITGKSYTGTSPKPYYLIHKATEAFGPCGIGWGFHIVSERIEEGSDGDKMHIANVRVWYEWNGKRGEVEHVGATPFSGKRASGKFFIDEDANKKSVTDALVKALSMIGFAGDIFMGRYDDSKYVSEVKQEFEEERRAAEPPPTAGYFVVAHKRIHSFQTREALNDWWTIEKENRVKFLTKEQSAALLDECRRHGETLGQPHREAAE